VGIQELDLKKTQAFSILELAVQMSLNNIDRYGNRYSNEVHPVHHVFLMAARSIIAARYKQINPIETFPSWSIKLDIGITIQLDCGT
jgi:hypothetical protein